MVFARVVTSAFPFYFIVESFLQYIVESFEEVKEDISNPSSCTLSTVQPVVYVVLLD